MARRRRDTDPPSHDSFLDIVANLVGILIILIMVVGIQAKSAMVTVSIQEKKPEEKKKPDAATPKKVSKGITANLHAVEKQIRDHQAHAKIREAERNKTLQVITAIRRSIDQERKSLQDDERNQFDKNRKLIRGRSQLNQLVQQTISVRNAKIPAIKVEHLPTPKAGTVFGRELHVRLKQGLVCFVPLQALVDRMKAQLPEKFQKLRRQNVVHEVIGPIDGFKMKYTLTIGMARRETRYGPQTQKIGQFSMAELIPVRSSMGEPLERALTSGSQLDQRLRLRNPRKTTVTVWVYPDSYAEFRRFKVQLFKRGFLVAARPLPQDQKIGLSSNGSRSAAQ